MEVLLDELHVLFASVHCYGSGGVVFLFRCLFVLENTEFMCELYPVVNHFHCPISFIPLVFSLY